MVDSSVESAPGTTSGFRFLKQLVDVRPLEVAALGWLGCIFSRCSFPTIFCWPIRDEMGVAGGVENLPWLFTGTLIGMLVVNPAFAALVAKLPRVKFIAVAYRFFMVNLFIFALLLAWRAA